MAADSGRFTFRASGTDVRIFRGGVHVTTLRGPDARTFLARTELASDETLQQLMARVTGNYKRGNERQAKGHPRNR
jgi:hypothetical protein